METNWRRNMPRGQERQQCTQHPLQKPADLWQLRLAPGVAGNTPGSFPLPGTCHLGVLTSLHKVPAFQRPPIATGSLFKLDKNHKQKIRELGIGRVSTLLKPATTQRKTRDGAITCPRIEASGPPAKLCAAIQCQRRAPLPCIPTYSSESIPSCLPQKQVFV